VRHLFQIALYGCVAIALAGAGAGAALEDLPVESSPTLMTTVAGLQQDPQAVAEAIVQNMAGR
jgi:hypothetical protein